METGVKTGFLMNFNVNFEGCSKQDRLLHPPSLRAGSSASSSDSLSAETMNAAMDCIENNRISLVEFV